MEIIHMFSEKKLLLTQIDLVEEQYHVLVKEYGELCNEWYALKNKRRELKKQVDNLAELIEESTK